MTVETRSPESLCSLKERRLLIVGSGFIATHLANAAHAKWGWQVQMIYRNHRPAVPEGIRLHQLPSDVTTLSSLVTAVAPTDIIIALGSSFVPEINRDLGEAMRQHLDGPLMVMDAISRLPVRLAGHVLIIGSASEYGQFPEHPVDESFPTNPQDHYGHLKLTLHELGLYYHRHHGVPVVHVRQFNVTGTQQDSRFVLPSICRQIVEGARQGRKEFSIVAGNTTVSRDFLAIDDLCRAYQTLLLHGQAGQVYNVCSGQAHRISELIDLGGKLVGARVEVKVSEHLLRENDKVQSIICGNPARLQALGWSPKTSMRDLLASMIAHYNSQA
ncbi:GDP-mannose 4,6-dehydratase [Herbaspirillum sp. C9C3]|uniref:NAD-dependent epimerase/dehydratase family protein n=1 Tax=Herbaspirillum sp. C9C3 TaxID=2735271 RepID=UPI001584AC1D|nr:GDP-mannose 4,6-dehydratase [Herbaspirillum sp. C9C3]NUT60282.1 NAD-dependent epimerase/dehydratase family protein [Herbaspirillum sp. C9C3]